MFLKMCIAWRENVQTACKLQMYDGSMFPCICDKICSVWHLEHEILLKMNILSIPALRNQVAQNVHSFEEKMFKLLVNDKSMMVQCSLSYIVTLAM